MHTLFGATRPREFIAFLSIKVRTGEGPAYVFSAVDAITQYAFHLGVERDDKPETVVKNVYQLTENHDFKRFGEHEFTLVLDEYEEHTDRIRKMIAPVNGKIVVDASLNHAIAHEFLKSLESFFSDGDERR